MSDRLSESHRPDDQRTVHEVYREAAREAWMDVARIKKERQIGFRREILEERSARDTGKGND